MIKFTRLFYKNFLSTGQAGIELFLDKNQMTLITANNGSGKSTAMDAICFALFGKAYRNINKPQLLNSINQKKALTEVDFTVGGIDYKVVRGIKPAVFEIYENGNLMNQNPNVRDYQQVLEQQILKMNYTAFTQVVVMGSSNYIPFMRLKTNERRDFIENLLDIKIFSLMGNLLKDKQQVIKEELRVSAIKIQSLQEKIELQKSFIASKIQDKETKIQKLYQDIEDSKTTLSSTQAEYAKLDEIHADLEKQLSNYTSIQSKIDDLTKMRNQIIKNHKKVSDDKENHINLCTCPTCHQQVTQEAKEKVVSDLDKKISAFADGFSKIDEKINLLLSQMEGHSELVHEINDVVNALSTANQTMHSCNVMIKKLMKQITEYETTSNSEEEEQKLVEFENELVVTTDNQADLREDVHYFNLIQHLLKDSGIKAKIIAQYVPVINKLVNKYLGMLDFWVSFNLDEQFNEIIKSRHRDLFTYESFSAGEKTRIDFALMLTWREIASLKNSASTNLLFLDEIGDATMDAQTTELLMGILSSMKDSNIFIISHREGLQDKFRHVIKLEKRNNFTVIV